MEITFTAKAIGFWENSTPCGDSIMAKFTATIIGATKNYYRIKLVSGQFDNGGSLLYPKTKALDKETLSKTVTKCYRFWLHKLEV